MNRLLDLARPEQADEVRQFLSELPEIRSRRLAFNRGTTFADAFAVATPCWPWTAVWSRRSLQPSTRQKRIVSTTSVKNSRRPSALSALSTDSNRAEKAVNRASRLELGSTRRRRYTQAAGQSRTHRARLEREPANVNARIPSGAIYYGTATAAPSQSRSCRDDGRLPGGSRRIRALARRTSFRCGSRRIVGRRTALVRQHSLATMPHALLYCTSSEPVVSGRSYFSHSWNTRTPISASRWLGRSG